MRFLTLPNSTFYDLIGLSFLLAVLFGIGLGDRPYSAPSESRYIEIGREMAESGDFVTPRLNYVKYFEKPPLFYWIQAESTRLFGDSPFAARVPTTAFAILICLITYALTRMLYGRLAGWLGALTLATSLYIFAHSRIVLLDAPVSFFLAATLTCFLYAAYARPGKGRTAVIYGMYLAAAGAVLTKGLIGAVLPGAVIFLWLCCTGRWDTLKGMRLISGTLLFLLVAAPWHVLVAERNPEWAWFYFVHEHWLRYFTPEAGRDKPIWFFAAVAVAGWFPWIVFLSQAKLAALKGCWKNRRADGKPLFLLLWIGFIFIFYSLSHSKLTSYIIPIFPPLAAILGRYLAAAWEEKPVRGFHAGLWGVIGLFALMAVTPALLLGNLDKDNKIVVALAQRGDDLRILSYASMISAGLLVIVYVQGRKRHVITAMLVLAALILQLGDQVAAHYDKDSMKGFAAILRQVMQPGDETAMYQVYYQDMPIYMGRRITVADWKGELEFGTKHEDTSAWMLDDAAFWQRWLKNDHRMFVVMREDAFARLMQDKTRTPESLHLYQISQDGRNLMFMNRPLTTLTSQKDTKKP